MRREPNSVPKNYPTPAACKLRGGPKGYAVGRQQNLPHLGFNKEKLVGEGIDARYSVSVAKSNKRLFCRKADCED